MTNPKMARLLARLVEKTDQGKVSWEETEQTDVYQAAFPGYSVRISYREATGLLALGTTDYLLSIFNEDGTQIDEASDVDLKSDYSDSFNRMKKLHEDARRKALGVDEALDKILAELDKEK